MKGRSKYLQITAYVFLIAISIIIIGVTRDCGRIPYAPREGFSGGDTLDIALLYGPGGYYTYGDSISGINHQIAVIFSEETLTPVNIWPISDPASGMNGLQTGAFDALASLPLDNYIKKRYRVSESIFLDRLVLIQMADSTGNTPINSSLDLNGKSVYVAAGSSAINRLRNLSEEIGGNIEIVEEPDMSDELITLKVVTRDYPLAVVNERVAKAMAKNYPGLKYDSSVSFTQFQVWVFNPADSLSSRKFNNWFDQFRETEKYRNIISKF